MYTLRGYHDEGKTQFNALFKGRRGNPLSVGIKLVGSFKAVIFLDYYNKKYKPKKERKKKKMVLLR